MSTQSEYALEESLIKQLEGMEYSRVTIDDEGCMLANLKRQLEIHNKVTLSNEEFDKVLNRLNTGDVFTRAGILRDKPFPIKRENGEEIRISFINSEDWCLNEFQVTNQISIEGRRKTRYDVTILINGLPLIQIELKRRGIELKEAFNQIQRYHHTSYDAGYGLFQYVQLFIISNGVNTKYYSNNKKAPFEQTFFWTDKLNNRLSDLNEFSAEFLKPCHIAKMITQYMVLTQDQIIKVLRPYQFYAAEALINQVKASNANAYIWHTTGSGKTLTSFKASQIIVNMPKVHKVIFVVDRKDLDYQTAREFNSFAKGSIDITGDTSTLVKQLSEETPKLVLTTIQKLNNAIMNGKYLSKIGHLQDKKIVFIFDECHRSQFGDTHQNIKTFFKNAQMFGFTGTPILAENATGSEGNKQTTKSLFGECLHKYVIVDAIKDENVLRFAVEYVGRYQRKESASELDIDVEAIDTKGLLDSPKRLSKITDYILEHHRQKTKSPEFTAMFCVSSVENLIQYYQLFKQKQEGLAKPLRIATIFSYAANEADPTANGLDNGLLSGIIPEENPPTEGAKVNQYSRDHLDSFIQDYNVMFGTKYSTNDSQSFYNYYQDIAKQVRQGEIDILLVVNMFLTGFDSPRLNTLYVDKNLKFHGLIQAFSRTNRILNEKKSQGNIVCFRNLKEATDEAIALFSNKNAKETVLLEPYEDYVTQFNKATEQLLAIAPTVGSVDSLRDEKEELIFVTRFRELLRIKNILTTFSDFKDEDLGITAQTFEDYKSKYLDIHDKVKKATEENRVSVLEDIDFELSLIHRDEINVAYILNLLVSLKKLPPDEAKQRHKEIIDLVAGEVQLRSKRELIERFIEENLPKLNPNDNVIGEFESFWSNHRAQAFKDMCADEKINPEQMEKLINDYLFANKFPRNQQIKQALEYSPGVIESKSILDRIAEKVRHFVTTYIEGMGGSV
ncbi:type I restriction endonuclease subunit R [Polynucleobacter paneuropaeus]|uniref:Type I restriction enzyme endonuclease subunit n=1 Tax=Polynucleobacter paneuropaeus TaxID=2527775 RepID=A0AAE2YK20_9BURK|nr:type I restriction endonuclease subunit R [Polynucleobacter paneuropaeus]MBT8591003.1 type I restriction endonuclease subunit R [Polynucleobacter paneuropaeus]MBT8596394.1 type I restriction endonuclease subunit R [Polynucleobacter paneuropaeus]MBT8598207.1 type I restriction endonuclease subunit R [Polynucleobacter paneuropaeus]